MDAAPSSLSGLAESRTQRGHRSPHHRAFRRRHRLAEHHRRRQPPPRQLVVVGCRQRRLFADGGVGGPEARRASVLEDGNSLELPSAALLHAQNDASAVRGNCVLTGRPRPPLPAFPPQTNRGTIPTRYIQSFWLRMARRASRAARIATPCFVAAQGYAVDAGNTTSPTPRSPAARPPIGPN